MHECHITSQQRAQQRQMLTPKLQQAVRLLHMPSSEFAMEIRQVASSNLFLEALEFAAGDELDDASQPLGETGLRPESDGVDETVNDGDIASCQEPSRASDLERGMRPQGVDHALDYNIPDTLNLREHLREQIRLQTLAPRMRQVAELIVEALDDDGYLRLDLDEIGGLLDLSPVASQRELATALALVQTLEPCGVGARSLQECLALQVEMIPDPCQRDMAATIIQEHMDLLASRDHAGLCAVLKRDQDDVRAVCERIRRMAPHPGWRFDNSSVQYVIPDVIAEKRQGKWRASLNPAAIPFVRMNHRYATLIQRQRDQGHQALFEQLREARWTMRNISQRFQTILDVASAILRRQYRFLEYGAVGMKPLGLQEIAQELGLHESTVSRAVNGKYMATTTGVFELRQFFSSSLPTHNGGMCSAVAMRGIIQDMIEHEDPHNPYSDAEISRLLARQGLAVARRTVTKYRQGMKIQAVAMRRHD